MKFWCTFTLKNKKKFKFGKYVTTANNYSTSFNETHGNEEMELIELDELCLVENKIYVSNSIIPYKWILTNKITVKLLRNNNFIYYIKDIGAQWAQIALNWK